MIIESVKSTRRPEGLMLIVLILGAFLARALVLWVNRPEFTGWFNHAPWYWVQTRGVLETGALPFSDLPLLFLAYAGVARILEGFGLAQDPAIVHATRLVMCLTPALIAWPCWAMLRRIKGENFLTWTDWLLLGLAAFLPLTVAHLPELLQKNMLGMLFLAGLLHASYRALDRPAWVGAAGAWFALIAFTHLGTLAAACFWLAALGVAMLLERRAPQRRLIAIGVPLLVAAGAMLLAWLVLFTFDPAALHRVGAFLETSLPRSPVGGMFGEASVTRRITLAAAAVLPPAISLWLVFRYRSVRTRLTRPDRIFWLANLLFCGLLMLPVIDLAVLPRLLLFLPLPLWVLLAFARHHSTRPAVARSLLAVAALGVALVGAGEAHNLYRMSRGTAQTHEELVDLGERYGLGNGDFIIAPYAVAPNLNWFLGVQAGLITALEREDFERRERVFVLNTGREQQRDWENGVHVESDGARDRLMRQPVPVPEGLEGDENFRQFDFFRLETLPEEWTFDESGRWSGVMPARGFEPGTD